MRINRLFVVCPDGADGENRTLASTLATWRPTFELHPRVLCPDTLRLGTRAADAPSIPMPSHKLGVLKTFHGCLLWSGRRESNPPPSDWKSDASPLRLLPHWSGRNETAAPPHCRVGQPFVLSWSLQRESNPAPRLYQRRARPSSYGGVTELSQ